MKVIAVSAFLVCFLSLEFSLVSAQGNAKPPSTPLTPSSVFALAKDSVVTIRTPSGQGSGVIVGSRGLVVTNLHVLADNTTATVHLANGDIFDVAAVVSVDERRDLVLVRTAGFAWKTAHLSNSDSVSVGDSVLAIGTPSGFELSLSDGIVSAVRDSGDGYRVIQTTAAVSPGSSGGGLFNANGELIGITTFKIRNAENLSFAVPINYVRGLMEIPEHMESLTDMNARLSARPSAQSDPKRSSTPGSVRSAPAPIDVPRLETSYRHPSGPKISVRQGRDAATLTFYRVDSSIYGNGSVSWDEARGGFIGTAELVHLCGSMDRRITTLKSGLEVFLDSAGTIKMRYQSPVGINCTRGQVRSFAWAEDTWYPN